MAISKKEDGKYLVHLGLKWIDGRIVVSKLKEEMLKDDIDQMMPEGFSFKEGEFSSDRPSHGVWVQKKRLGENAICCEVVRGHQDYRTPDGMSTWYWTYYISVWYTVGRFLGFSLGDEKELDAICRKIAQMIDEKYEIKAMTKETIMNLPEKTVIFSRGYGASVEKGVFSTMSKFGKQFVKEGKLNSNLDLGFSFVVNGYDGTRASITITKL